MIEMTEKLGEQMMMMRSRSDVFNRIQNDAVPDTG